MYLPVTVLSQYPRNNDDDDDGTVSYPPLFAFQYFNRKHFYTESQGGTKRLILVGSRAGLVHRASDSVSG